MAGLDRLLAGRGGKVEGSEQTETPGFTACSGSVTDDDDDDDEGRRAPRPSSSSTARILVPTPKTQVAALQLLPVQEPLSSSSSYEEPRHIREGNGKKPCLVASKVKEPAFQGSSYDGQPQCTFPFYSQNPDTCAHGGGEEGDVTLADINARIMMRPRRPVRHPVGEYANGAWVSPAGRGLSGKAVVSLTRIQTQGTGTITIVRTKG
ncbi:hypothetical protein GW17_00014658 [Ensete ventricosum]|nr:hypothetical protein GW17_00014658 [Ensete ventricosum]